MLGVAPEPVTPVDGKAAAPAGLRGFWKRHHGKLWWIHSAWALTLGVIVMAFAAKGFAYSRWLLLSLVAIWAVTFLVFRIFGVGRARKLDGVTTKLGFFVMTYVLKNLYQTMLFFLLPFYFKATTFSSRNAVFFGLLALCAFLSTMDVIFDRVVMRWRSVAAVFNAITLFACLNVSLPALLPSLRSSWVVLWAAGITVVVFWLFHVPLRVLRHPVGLIVFALCIAGGVAGAWYGRAAIPPVPNYVKSGEVGPALRPDGRLASNLDAIEVDKLETLYAEFDVVVPTGEAGDLRIAWRCGGKALRGEAPATTYHAGPTKGIVRMRSRLARDRMPLDPVGRWSVEVVTDEGRLVGRRTFEVRAAKEPAPAGPAPHGLPDGGTRVDVVLTPS
jgi:hypothetical protein